VADDGGTFQAEEHTVELREIEGGVEIYAWSQGTQPHTGVAIVLDRETFKAFTTRGLSFEARWLQEAAHTREAK